MFILILKKIKFSLLVLIFYISACNPQSEMRYYDDNSNYPFPSSSKVFQDIDSLIFIIPEISCGPCKHKILSEYETLLNVILVFTEIKDKARLYGTIKDYELLEKSYIIDYENTYSNYVKKKSFFYSLSIKERK